jgi:predicted ATPase/DNA-binding XRE family transcriptional regulator
MSNTRTFGQWLKRRRKALGLTQKEMAQQAGCAEVTLRKIEAGDLQPSAPLVASLAGALGVADADLPGLLSLARGVGDDFSTRARLLRLQRANNLPAQLTPLIGREHDIAAVRKRLLSDGARLVTLVGPPGVGKTRLALAVAEDVLEQFEHGAFFVRLGPVSDPALVAAAIAQALGMEMSGPNPPALQLRAWLEEKHVLLALDNFEQIVAAAPLVDDLLRRCPWLHVLVTSRQPLRVRGERQMSVRPLALPVAQPGAGRLTGDDALRYAAVALFAERAEAVQPDFTVDDGNAAAVAEICRRLDGLPLAIELVAARVKLLPPAELLARLRGPWLLSTDGLRDVSERQRTLRGAIDWSYNLLTPLEQTLFTRLAVFVGGCTLEAAEMMCEDVLSPGQVLAGIASLLDKSLLHREVGVHGETRYIMLETVREYGLERAASSGKDAALRVRHLSCFLQLIERAEHSGPEIGFFQVRYLVDGEIHNVRAALAWAMENDVQAALVLAAVLLDWFGQRGPYAEGKQVLDEVFALPDASAHTIPRAKALCGAGILMLYCHEDGKAQAYEEECLVLSQELGYTRGEADALLGLGQVAVFGWQDQETASCYFERSLTSYRKIDDSGGASIALAFLAEIAGSQADFSRARSLSEESLAIAKQAGFQFAWPWSGLAEIAYAEGDLARARMLYERRLTIEQQRGCVGANLATLLDLAMVATRQGDFAAAHAFLDEVLPRAKQYGSDDDLDLCWCYLLLAILVQTEGDYHSAVRWYRASAPGIRYWKFDACVYGLGLTALAVALDKHELAAGLLGVVEAACEIGSPLWPIERDDYNRLADAARVRLGTETFDSVWLEGRQRPFVEVVEEAVATLETVLGIRDDVTAIGVSSWR